MSTFFGLRIQEEWMMDFGVDLSACGFLLLATS
jgi:hypothetical protein